MCREVPLRPWVSCGDVTWDGGLVGLLWGHRRQCGLLLLNAGYTAEPGSSSAERLRLPPKLTTWVTVRSFSGWSKPSSWSAPLGSAAGRPRRPGR